MRGLNLSKSVWCGYRADRVIVESGQESAFHFFIQIGMRIKVLRFESEKFLKLQLNRESSRRFGKHWIDSKIFQTASERKWRIEKWKLRIF